MSGRGYQVLGFAVWHGAKWYLRRRYGVLVSRKVLTAGVVVVAVGGLGLLAGRRGGSSP